MRTLATLFLFAAAFTAAGQVRIVTPKQDTVAEERPVEFSPRVVALVDAPHPQALITFVDPVAGVFLFTWLDAKGKPIDSGNSIGRMTPGEPGKFPDDATIRSSVTAAAAPQAPAPIVKSDRERLAALEAEVVTLKTATTTR